MQISFTTVAAIWMIGSLAMVPVLGLTIRFAVLPLLHSVARLRSVDARLAAMEERLDALTRELRKGDYGSRVADYQDASR
jgi:hypothetical protein